MQIIAGIYQDEVLISRARHDFCSSLDGKAFIDGGQLDYVRGSNIKMVIIDIGCDTADLYNDWARREYKFVGLKVDDVKIIEEKDLIKRDTQDWRMRNMIWGVWEEENDKTNYKRLFTLETAHLKNILLRSIIYTETREVIGRIFEFREAAGIQ